MCLLISGKSKTIRATLLNTAGLLDDIFQSNADGVGAMYVTSKGVLRTPKVLPNTFGECRAFIAQLPDDDSNLALHFRMRTHGATDLTNCHPYPVIEGKIALMHNGVLSQGNKADITKSDTWHYIKDVVRPMLEEAPKMFLNQAWLNLVEDDISTSNRFAIMDSDGDLVILNKQTGIEHDGMWFSNTYAWSPELLIPGYKKKVSTNWSGYGYGRGRSSIFDDQDAWDDYYSNRGYGTGTGTALTTVAKGSTVGKGDSSVGSTAKALFDFDADDVWAAVAECDVHEVADYLEDRPLFTLKTLLDDCEFVPGVDYLDQYSEADAAVVKALVDQDESGLARRCMLSPNAAMEVAQVICWYGDWMGKAINEKAEVVGEPVLEAAEDEIREAIAQELALAQEAEERNAAYAG